ncbi:MAG: phosphotransferase [Patescibacteria group bacterium]
MLQIKTARLLVEQAGYEPAKILMAAGRYVVFRARKGKRDYAIKCSEPDEAANLHNESVVNRFLHSVTPRKAGFIFPRSEFIGTEDGALLISDFVAGRWLGYRRPVLHSRLSLRDLESIYEVMVFLAGLAQDELPESLVTRARREFTPRYYHAKMDWYAAPALEAGLLDRDELAHLHSMVGLHFKRSFAHHDLVPWNLCRLKDGRLAVTDSEFARWGIAWYDMAYLYLQLAALEKNRALARRAFRYLAGRFKAEGSAQGLEQGIFPALAFRITGNLWIAARERDKRRAARSALEVVLSGEFSRLLI